MFATRTFLNRQRMVLNLGSVLLIFHNIHTTWSTGISPIVAIITITGACALH